MPKLDALPVELLAHVALFTNEVSFLLGKRLGELLNLRCASRSCRDAVRRAATQHLAVRHFHFGASNSAQTIAAVGRVFGSSCRGLNIGAVQSNNAGALHSFVTSTNGQLRDLTCTGSASTYLTMPDLREMCRACPLLKSLYVTGPPVGIITAANLDDFASAVGSACPLLETVSIPCELSPGEDYQWYFPRSVSLRFGRVENDHLPIRWDGIQRTLQACTHATEVKLAERTVPPQWVDLLLAAPLASVLKVLDLNWGTAISPESILRLVRGFGVLSALKLPEGFDGGSAFYSSLVQARPSIEKLDLGVANMLDDDALRIICHGLRLERLELVYVRNLTDRAIDIILESPCAQTLRTTFLSYPPLFSSARVLRLVRGCPRLTDPEWEPGDEHPLSRTADGANVEAMNALLESRGGEPFQYGF
jgi:hypothetical protein